jgi:hypothetical protein
MRRRLLVRAVTVIALVAACAVCLDAASRTRSATGRITVGALAKLSISTTSISFGSENPDTTPQIQAGGGAITITTKVRTTVGSTVSLSVLASDDLRSSSATIPISAVTWAVTGAGFVAGTMNKTVAQSVGSWVSSGARSGTQTYQLANSWTYATGSYSATFTYTLSAP